MVSYTYNFAGVPDLNVLAALAVRVMPARGSWGAHERLPTVALARAWSAVTREGLAAWRAMGAELGRPYYLGLLAEAYGKVGQTEAGLSALAEALGAMDNHGECYWKAELYRLKGELLLAGSATQHAAVQTYYARALDVARSQQAKSLELRAAISLSRLWQRQVKRAEAYQLLAPSYNWFTEGFDTADLREAKALLAEVS
jgi:predicted ATPase